jgi:hypothetical protein
MGKSNGEMRIAKSAIPHSAIRISSYSLYLQFNRSVQMPVPPANQDSWEILPLPTNRISLGFAATYDDSEAERMRQGFIPRQMEDKWFIYFKEGWLYFYRSWTGACIFGVQLDSRGGRVIDSWITADQQQTAGKDLEYYRKLVGFLIDTLLLGKKSEFPAPSDLPEELASIYQHHIVGVPPNVPAPRVEREKTALTINGYTVSLANKFLAFGYFIYAAAIILFIILWLASVTIRLSQTDAALTFNSLAPIVGLLVAGILFTALNIAVGRRLLADDRSRLTWILVIVSLLEIPIGTGLAFLTLLWLFARRNRT